MTDTTHLEALAMRTRAADEVTQVAVKWGVIGEPIVLIETRDAILALPLEADPAALVAEAMKLPEVRDE